MIYIGLFLFFVGIFGFSVVAWITNRRDTNRIDAVKYRKIAATAESALRNIANGAGNPTLEAQIALDSINSHYLKEIK